MSEKHQKTHISRYFIINSEEICIQQLKALLNDALSSLINWVKCFESTIFIQIYVSIFIFKIYICKPILHE